MRLAKNEHVRDCRQIIRNFSQRPEGRYMLWKDITTIFKETVWSSCELGYLSHDRGH